MICNRSTLNDIILKPFLVAPVNEDEAAVAVAVEAAIGEADATVLEPAAGVQTTVPEPDVTVPAVAEADVQDPDVVETDVQEPADVQESDDDELESCSILETQRSSERRIQQRIREKLYTSFIDKAELTREMKSDKG